MSVSGGGRRSLAALNSLALWSSAPGKGAHLLMSPSAANRPDPGTPGPGRAWAVPGYTEVRVLGGGGFGEVVLATHC